MAGLRSVVNFRYSVAVGRLLQADVVPRLRGEVFDKLQRLDFRFFDSNASGSIINRVTGDVQSLRSFIDGVLIQSVILMLSLAVYLVYMVGKHLPLTLACLASTPLLWLGTMLFSRWVQPAYAENRRLADNLVLALSEGVQGIQVVRGFGGEPHELVRFQSRNRQLRDQQRRIFRRVSLFSPGVSLVGQLNIVVLLFYGGWIVRGGGLSLGDLIVFAGLLQQFSGQVTNLATVVNTLQQSLIGARRVFEVMDAPVAVQSPPSPERPTHAGRGGAVRERALRLCAGPAGAERDRSRRAGGRAHRHPGRDRRGQDHAAVTDPALLRSGQRAGVHRRTRRARPGSAPTCAGRSGWCSRRASCSPTRWRRTSPSASPRPAGRRSSARRRLARAHEFIQALPDGYDTRVGEGGHGLSGGQRQRLALARALLLEPRILLLDDPAAALDPGTEEELFQALENAIGGRTTFIIAHRLSTLRRADRILVLADGKIVQQGTHDQLVRQGGPYLRAMNLEVVDAEPVIAGKALS